MTQVSEIGSEASPSIARRARGDRNPSAHEGIRAAIGAQNEIVQNEPNCPQLAKRSGALRVCALWRAARAGPKIRRMQNF
jgi:hypothetical protein